MKFGTYRKYLALMLAAGLAVSGLTGCRQLGQSSQSGASSQSGESAAQSGEEEQQEAASEKEEMPDLAVEEGKIVPDVVVERAEVDTSDMIPVEYSCEVGSIGLYLPKDWNYNIDEYRAEQGCFSISLWPESEQEGEIVLEYMEPDVIGWQGADEIGAEMFDYTGHMGTYEGNTVWDYFRCSVEGSCYVIMNAAGGFWWENRSDEINNILSTVRFADPLMGSSREAGMDEEFTAAGKNVKVYMEAAEQEEDETDGGDAGSLYAECGEQKLLLDDYTYGCRKIIVLPYSDTVEYILVYAYYDNDYGKVFLLKADAEAEETLTISDEIDAAISASEGVTTAGFGLAFRLYCFGTYEGEMHYTILDDKFYTDDTVYHLLNESGTYMNVWEGTEDMDGEALANMSLVYTEDGRRCLTPNQDIKAYTSGGEEIIIPEGMQICPTDIDMENLRFYFDFLQYESSLDRYLTNYGYFQFEKSDEKGITVNGISEFDLFDNLPYAG